MVAANCLVAGGGIGASQEWMESARALSALAKVPRDRRSRASAEDGAASQLVDELNEKFGPVPAELLEQAAREWPDYEEE